MVRHVAVGVSIFRPAAFGSSQWMAEDPQVLRKVVEVLRQESAETTS